MMLRNLLVHVSGDETGRRRLALALDLAQRTGAHLTGMHVMPPADTSPIYKPSQVAVAVDHVARRLQVNAQSAKAIFLEETAHGPVEAQWTESRGEVAKGISDRAHAADLVILGQDERQEPPQRYPLPIAHSVVLQCGRPVMVVPSSAQSLALDKVAIAWDGSREAVRAVHDALPLLRMAKSVHIVTIITPSDGADESEVKDLAAHLAKHGVVTDALVKHVARSDERTYLQHILEKGGYDLIVMGGYSHPRWLEFIFGGTTLHTLLTSNVSVLVAH